MAWVGKTAWFAWESAYECLVDTAVLVRKPGRSFCQYVALHRDLAHLAPQFV